MTIAQVRVPDDTNETTQANALPDVMPVPESDPAIITIDAAHTRWKPRRLAGKDLSGTTS